MRERTESEADKADNLRYLIRKLCSQYTRYSLKVIGARIRVYRRDVDDVDGDRELVATFSTAAELRRWIDEQRREVEEAAAWLAEWEARRKASGCA
jgi:hypothetical protein